MHNNLTKNSTYLLSLLRSHADNEGNVGITLSQLAREMQVCVNTVISAVGLLEKSGLVQVTREQRSKNAIGKESAGRNIYRLL
ncbi:helix-turn-helix domain-containing protein [Rahnella sp. PAMC 25559]|uniref:helix-turn-helix domain-containing protein n=1 Tax=Rahnella sp. PAMC 25559 TaxID=3423225 RepID=UPI003D67B018